ncbi:MAG: hypothetical protein JXN64_11590 [Spirochaetes bacterium]|nr:hypothetical protein [Spirochaetota bacterium]
MIKGVKTITDRNLFQNILKKFFYNRISFIYSQKANIEVQFLDTPDGLVNIQIPFDMEEQKNCIAYTRNENNIIVVFLKYVSHKTKDILVFNPAKFQVMSVERKDERRSIIEAGIDKSLLYITNFITDKIIGSSLTSQEKILKRIKEIIEYDHLKEYEYLKIFFWNENISDPRMKFFFTNRNHIFIPDMTFESGDYIYRYYLNNIYNQDAYLKTHKELISEISVPILFDLKIPYGYIQVNKYTPFPKSSVTLIKRLASIVDELAKKSNLFSVSNDKLLVSDISKTGVGIVFNNQKYIPYYKKDSYVSMDLLLPHYKKASMLADVRHLEMMHNKTIKVGFEIKDMDSASRDNYEKFLGLIE